jgi:superfamily II DNA or RNA helicase
MAANKYDYQERVAQKTLEAAMKSGKAVCAISCGGGKTTVGQLIISKYIASNGASARILVITENNNALKTQFLSELNNAHVPIDFSYGEIESSQNVQVRVGIAASLHKLSWDKVDLVICDEAHTFQTRAHCCVALLRRARRFVVDS